MLYVCYDLPCMCVCHVCVPSNRCVCAKTSGIQEKCQNPGKVPESTKSTKSDEIHEIRRNPGNPAKQAVYYRPLYTTFHFANDRPSGGPILGFRCTTPHETVIFDPTKSTHSGISGFGRAFRDQEHFFEKKRLRTGIIVHKFDHFFRFREAPNH